MHKIAFQLGSLTLTWYGIFVATGFLVGIWTASRRGLRDGIAPEKVIDMGPWLLVGAILGARILYVISYWDDLMKHPLFPNAPWTEVFMIQRGGLVYYGGFIGASAGCILYTWRTKLPLWKLADVLAPSIALGYFFGRFGCLMNGCCYGKICDLPWAIRYPNQSDVWFQHFESRLVGQFDPSLPVHPTQIYDSLLNLGLFVFLAWLYRRKKFDGQVFAAYLIGYACTRSLVEIFRGDYTQVHYFAGLTPAQMVSILIVAIGILLMVVLPRTPRTQAAQ